MILLVEDNEDDVFLMQRAFVKAKLTVPVHIASDGQQALDYLSGVGKYNDRLAHPIPAAVFLDLKLPYVHGFEVLRWIREQPTLKQLNVFILTSSPEDRDRERAKDLGARAYLVKPPTADVILQAWRLLSESEVPVDASNWRPAHSASNASSVANPPVQ